MPTDKKKSLILLLLLACAAALLLILNLHSRIKRLERNLSQESSSRLKLIEKVSGIDEQTSRCFQERRALAEKTAGLEEQLNNERAGCQECRQALLNEQERGRGLEAKLSQAKSIQEILELERKEALLKKQEAAKQAKKKR